MADYIYSMETRLTPDQQRGVNLVQEIAQRAGLNLYLTGGSIRDLVTGFPIRDIDLSIQGNPLKLEKELEKAGVSVQGTDEELRTLHLLMPGNVRAELNMTRAESHDKPGKPPSITPATINEDLRRRDFTVNAMALSLNPGSRGLLLDPFNGIADIEAKVLRVLHNYAFLEEPVRLIRATRLSARFHWPWRIAPRRVTTPPKRTTTSSTSESARLATSWSKWHMKKTRSMSCAPLTKKAG